MTIGGATSAPRLPPGVPPEVVHGLVSRILGEQPTPPPPGQHPPASPQAAPGTTPMGPGAAPVGPDPAGPTAPPHPMAQPPGGAPLPGEGPGGEGNGLTDEQAQQLKQWLSDPKSKRDVQKLIDGLGGRGKPGPLQVIDPRLADQLAEGWNATIEGLSDNLTTQRGIQPGASEASDEQLLLVYYATPSDLTLDDIPAYANAAYVYFVGLGWTDQDKIADEVMRECFPLRESLIKNGREKWADQVAFVDDMEALSERWIAKYGDLPRPDRLVQAVTVQGKGDPESMPRDADSEALPAGDRARQRTDR